MIRVYWAPSAEIDIWGKKCLFLKSTEIYDCVLCSDCWQIKHIGRGKMLRTLKQKDKRF